MTLIDGEQPAVQTRSKATRDAMLAAGRALLASNDFGSLTIADIAASAGVSVGSFYGRFRDKEAFFAVLVQELFEDSALQVNETFLMARDRGSEEIVSDMVNFLTEFYRRHQGVIRAILKHASNRPDSWSPAKRGGARLKDTMVVTLGPQLGHIADSQREFRIRFAMHLLFGALVHTVLNDPGPIKLADRKLEQELKRAFCAYLEIPL